MLHGIPQQHVHLRMHAVQRCPPDFRRSQTSCGVRFSEWSHSTQRISCTQLYLDALAHRTPHR